MADPDPWPTVLISPTCEIKKVSLNLITSLLIRANGLNYIKCHIVKQINALFSAGMLDPHGSHSLGDSGDAQDSQKQAHHLRVSSHKQRV